MAANATWLDAITLDHRPIAFGYHATMHYLEESRASMLRVSRRCYISAAVAAVVCVTTTLATQSGGALAAARAGGSVAGSARGTTQAAAMWRDPLAASAGGQQGASSAALPSSPLASQPSGGLAVYTTPDPTPVGSAAYIYSPATLAAAPVVQVISPAGRRYAITATLTQNNPPAQWWTAALPHGPAGIYRVAAVATTTAGAAVTGTSSYQVVNTGQPGSRPGQQWSPVGPGVMGGILAIDPTDRRTMYVASGLSSELFVSRDGGHQWRMERTLPVAGGYPTALLALPGRRGRLVLAVNGGNGVYVDDPTYAGKVLESSDGGRHWRDLGLPDSFVDALVATPDGSTLAAVTTDGIDITSDWGAHWTQLSVPWGGSSVSAASLAGGDLYVATLSGLYVVRDVEDAPTAPALVFTPPGQRLPWVVGVTGDAHTVYAVGLQGGIYVSPDAGATWTHVYDPPGLVTMFDDVAGTVYASSNNTVLVGTDGGATWTTWAEPVPDIDNQDVIDAGGTVYLGTWDTGFFTTRDQGAHYQWLGGVPDVEAYGLAVAGGPGGGEIVVGTNSDSYRSSADAAATGDPTAWGPPAPQVAFGETTPLVAASPDHSVVYKVRNGPRIGTYTIYASHDAGATWRQLGATQYGNPGALLVDPADPSDLYVAGDSDATGPTMIESRNAGATWSVVGLPAPVTALAGDPKNPGRLWLGGPDGLWVSDDSGRKDTRLQQVPVSALAALPGNRLVVGGFGLFVSSDGGVKLRPARQPDLDLSVSALLASPAQPDTLYAATGPFHTAGLLKGGHGVFRSTNDGRTWQPFSSGLTDLDVLSLAIAPDGRTLYAGTQRGGVYALSLDGGERRI
jgi:hypothetical protein